MNEKEIINEAVRRAQEVGRKKGLKIGQTVAHPSDRMTYELYSVDGEMAIVGLDAKKSPSGRKIKKQFPLGELFDPNDARKLLNTVLEDDLNRNAPPGIGVMVIDL